MERQQGGHHGIDEIINGIDNGMHENVIFMPDDHIRRLEDEVWAVLSESVEFGDITVEQATERFLCWRRTHLKLGDIATGGA